MASTFDFKGAAAELARRDFVSLFRRLGIDAVRSGNLYYLQPGPGSPARGSDSCVVYPNGTWKNFNGDGSGDLIALIRYRFGHTNQLDSLKWAHGYLGWGEAVLDRPVSDAELKRRDDEARAHIERDKAERVKLERQCRGQYLNMLPAFGYLPQVYLEQARGIDFSFIGKFPGVLRFEPNARYYKGAAYSEHPAMVAAFYAAGQIVGLHRTFLRPDGLGKASLGLKSNGKPYSQKKMRGTKQGAIIPLHKGAGNLGLAEASKRGVRQVVAICEGIEDGLTIAMAKPDWRVWAAGDKDNMAALIWPDIAERVVLVADNDGNTDDEQAANIKKVRDHWYRQLDDEGERSVTIVRSQFGKDFNDWLQV